MDFVSDQLEGTMASWSAGISLFNSCNVSCLPKQHEHSVCYVCKFM